MPHALGCVPSETGPQRRAQEALPAQPTLALRVVTQGAQKVNVAEVRPVRLAEVELAVGALPQQEPTEALLAGRADHEVRVRLALRVEVLGDVLHGEGVRDLLETRTLG